MMESDLKAKVSWALFDWANSAFPTVITTFVFSAYFTKAVAASPLEGTSQWGYAMGLAGLLIALGGPICGAIADFGGGVKRWLFGATVICCCASFGLWWVVPDPSSVSLALILVVLATFGFEIGMVFYNALLPRLVGAKSLGLMSGLSWGLGYFGGLACLILVLVGFVQPETPWFGIAKEQAANIRIIGPIVAIWVAAFAIPLFVFVPEVTGGRTLSEAIPLGISNLIKVIKNAGDHRLIFRFLIARMFYIDGLNTLFAFGGLYAAASFGFSFEDLIIFGIAMNVAAGLGACGFGWVDQRFGSRRAIISALICLSTMATAILLVQSVALFWGCALVMGLFIGPVQAASRSYMAELAPADQQAEMFGLFALSGKATAFLGPFVLALISDITQSQRLGMTSILVFFAIGLLMMLTQPTKSVRVTENG